MPVYDVPLIPQPTDYTCWAASAAMLYSYAEQKSVSVDDICKLTGLAKNPLHPMLTLASRFVGNTRLRLATGANSCNTASGWNMHLTTYGPLLIFIVEGPTLLHAVVLSGVAGDQLTVLNPLPMNIGKKGTTTAENLAARWEDDHPTLSLTVYYYSKAATTS